MQVRVDASCVVKTHFGAITEDGGPEVGESAVKSELGVKDGALVGGAGGMGIEDADRVTKEGACGLAGAVTRGISGASHRFCMRGNLISHL